MKSIYKPLLNTKTYYISIMLINVLVFYVKNEFYIKYFKEKHN